MADSLPRAERLTDDRPALVSCRHCNSYIVDNGGWRMTHTEPFRQVTIICDSCVQAAIDLSMAVTLAHAEVAAAAAANPVADWHGFDRSLPDTERCGFCGKWEEYGFLYFAGEDGFGSLLACGDCVVRSDTDPVYDASSVDYGRYVL